MNSNPFFDKSWLPPFDQLTPAYARQALDEQLTQLQTALPQYEATIHPTWESITELYTLTSLLGDIWGKIGNLLSLVNSDEWRAIEEEYQPKLIEIFQSIGQSRPIYDAMLTLQTAGQADGSLSQAQLRILNAEILGMKNAGVGLTGEIKDAFNVLQQQSAQLMMRFNNNVLDAVKNWSLTLTDPDQVKGLKPDFLTQAAQKAKGDPIKGPWKLTVDYASYAPVMQYAQSRTVRETYYKAHCTRATSSETDNTAIIEELLKLRVKIAKALGYDTYADLSLSTKMAPNTQAIEALLGELTDASKEAAKQEKADLVAFARTHGFTEETFMPWDSAYWSERQREAIYDYDAEALRAYFPLERVMQGLFDLIEKLFGMTLTQRKDDIHAWHEDVRVYEVRNGEGALIAGLYVDLYVRPETKNGGAWMNSIHTRDAITEKEVILPIAIIACNQTPPLPGEPATMRIDEVNTLFHEMGHALQHMLTTVDDPRIAGIGNVEWDAVEIASQFMENFCYDQQTLTNLSKHIKTGESLPKELFDRIYASRNYHVAMMMLRQNYQALTDLRLHSDAYPSTYENANAFKEAMAKELLIDMPIPEDRMLNSFAHIFCGGYSAGYYSYKWSEALSADLYMAFEEAGLTNDSAIRELGIRYRDTFLSLGGSVHPAELFRTFRGRDPDASAILHLAGLR